MPDGTPQIVRDQQPDAAGVRNALSKVERTILAVGTTIGKYTIIDEIDRGGMAVVYKALQLDLGREVALKVMPANISIHSRFLERFLSEAHAVAKLSHPYIVNIHEVAVENNTYYLAMDYIAGKNLYYFLHFEKPKVVDVLEITMKLCEALAYAHAQKIIHRDLKLNNVIMREAHTPVLIDFGLAKALESDVPNITRTGEIVGSPAYMAPERLTGGAVDHRSDICSLGIMLYEMLTFKNPYLDQRSIHQTTKNVMEAAPLPPRKLVPWLPPEIEAITLKAMAADPARRYQSMDEFREDIVRYQKGEAVRAQPPSIQSRARRMLRKYWPFITIAGIVAVFCALFGMLYYLQAEKGRSHWQSVFEDDFGDHELAPAWLLPRSSDGTVDTAWRLQEGSLQVRGAGATFVRLDYLFTRDLRFEFDVSASSPDFHDVGAFVYGSSPDSGYAVHIHRNGTSATGITFPGCGVLLHDAGPLEFPQARRYHVEIEKRQQCITVALNGVLVARRWDHFPALGRNHQAIGFFSRGGDCSFDNVRVFHRGIPRAPGPTLVADRLWERGDCQAALEEYRGLHVDFSNTDIVGSILIRIPDCLIRLGRCDEALETLRRKSYTELQDESARAQLLYLEGVANDRMGRGGAADSIYEQVLSRHPLSPVSQSAVMALVRPLAAQIAAGRLDSADAQLTALARAHPHQTAEFAKLHHQVLLGYFRKPATDKVVKVGRKLIVLYPKEEEVLSAAEGLTALGLLGLQQRQEAIDLLNKCVSTHAATLGVWDAWMVLASIYENSGNFGDAMTIYRKVYRECPKTVVTPWMARIKMGELAQRIPGEESAQAVFDSVIDADHPFPIPRSIARLYRGAIADNQFTGQWNRYNGGDRYYLYHLARKAILNKERLIARMYLQELVQGMPTNTWRYIQMSQLLTTLDKW